MASFQEYLRLNGSIENDSKENQYNVLAFLHNTDTEWKILFSKKL